MVDFSRWMGGELVPESGRVGKDVMAFGVTGVG